MRLRDGFHGTTALALFDILGFRERVRTSSLDELRQIVDYVDSAAAAARVSEDHVGSMVLSDTIILYASPEQEEGAAALITISASNLLNTFARARIPIRGALTYGELYVVPKKSRIAGKSLVAAYELEQQQEWCGAIVDPSALDVYTTAIARSPLPHELLAYPAPLKSGDRTDYYCVDWTHRYLPFSTDVKRIFEPGVNSKHDVFRKYHGTQSFFDHCTGTRRAV